MVQHGQKNDLNTARRFLTGGGTTTSGLYYGGQVLQVDKQNLGMELTGLN